MSSELIRIKTSIKAKWNKAVSVVIYRTELAFMKESKEGNGGKVTLGGDAIASPFLPPL